MNENKFIDTEPDEIKKKFIQAKEPETKEERKKAEQLKEKGLKIIKELDL